MKVLILVLTIIVLGCSVAFGGLWLHSQEVQEYRYTGKEVFYTAEDYQNFKLFLIQHNIEIVDVKALTSEPPILVSYKIIMPAHMEMPYTYEYKTDALGPYQEGASAVWGGGSVIALFLIIILITVLWKEEPAK